MIHYLKRIFLSLLHAGIGPDLSLSFRKKIRLSNLICVVLCLVTLPYAFVFTALGAPGLGALVVPIALAYPIFIGLNARGFYSISRVGIITLFNSAVTVYAISFGFASGIHLLFFPLACFSLILFEFRERLHL
ncbi:MAG TPA: hypothetical protein VE954_17925, partial [Oligoflexus sp.]|uniref:hypothetical protein n=1 Tax=Oligoflexus sp. TaxID=1971216 RepID=UPI002D648A5A